MDEDGGRRRALGVKSPKMDTAVAGGQPSGHRPPDRDVFRCRRIAVAAEDPDDRRVFVAFTQELAVDGGIVDREDLRAGAPVDWSDFVAPGRDHTDVHPQLGGAVDDPIDVAEVGVVRPGGILVVKREIAVGVGIAEALRLGDHDRLDHRESLGGPIFEVRARIVAVQPVEQIPGGIPKVEERGSVGMREEAAIGADGEHWVSFHR